MAAYYKGGHKMIPEKIPTRINKAFIFYSLLGIAGFAFLFGTVLTPIFSRKHRDTEERTAVNLPEPDWDKLVREFESAPTEDALSNRSEVPDMRPFISPVVNYPKTSHISSIKPIPEPEFTPDFAASAAASGIVVPLSSPIANTGQADGIYQSSAYSRPQTYQLAQDLLRNYGSGYPTQYTPTEYDLYKQANNQEEKKRFAESGSGGPTDLLGPNSIAPGTVIPAILVTGLNTDLPGYLMAQVSENIYDYVSGQNLLVPAGSRLLARYNSIISFGQQRVQVGWSEMITPSGTVVNLGNAPGVDAMGQSGLTGKVDNHLDRVLGGMGFSAMTTLLTGVSSSLVDQMLNQGAISATFDEVIAKLGDIGYEIAKRWLNVQPTITLKAGSRISVFVVNKLSLPAAEKPGNIKKYTRSKK